MLVKKKQTYLGDKMQTRKLKLKPTFSHLKCVYIFEISSKIVNFFVFGNFWHIKRISPKPTQAIKLLE
jgi:hypothetical protein